MIQGFRRSHFDGALQNPLLSSEAQQTTEPSKNNSEVKAMDGEMEKREPKTTYAGMSRRAFSLGVGGAAVVLAMGGLKAVPASAQVRPPGGQDENHLISACIRCERCVEACPRGALRPAHVEDGILGVRAPSANFDEGWCDFCEEENGGTPRCVQFCPTGALSLESGATAESTVLGKATIIEDWCLAWSKDNGCKFCFDACPHEAIELDPSNRPVVVLGNCNGCGACQSVCSSLKDGSIAVGATSRAIIVVPAEEAEA